MCDRFVDNEWYEEANFMHTKELLHIRTKSRTHKNYDCRENESETKHEVSIWISWSGKFWQFEAQNRRQKLHQTKWYVEAWKQRRKRNGFSLNFFLRFWLLCLWFIYGTFIWTHSLFDFDQFRTSCAELKWTSTVST